MPEDSAQLGGGPVGRSGGNARALRGRFGGLAIGIALVAIVALGLGLRVDAALNAPKVAASPDARGYAHLAHGLYANNTFAHPQVAHPELFSPGPPLYAAAFYKTFGERPALMRVSVAVIGGLTVLLAFVLGRRLVASMSRAPKAPPEGSDPPSPPRAREWLSAGGTAGALAGLGAALVVAIYPSFRYTNSVLLSEPFAAFTLLAAVVAILWASERRRAVWWWIAPGVFLGLTAMFRPEYLAIAGFFWVAVAIRAWRRDGFKPAAAAAVVLAVAVALPIAPWTIRNIATYDRVVLISAGGGKSFYIGTHLEGNGNNWDTIWWLLRKYPQLRGKAYRHKPTVEWIEVVNTNGDRVYEEAAKLAYPNLPTDQALSQMGRDNLDEYALGDPIAYTGFLFEKIWDTWRRGEWPPMRDPGWIAFHRTVVFLGLLGLVWLAWRRRWEALVLAIPIVGITLVSLLVNTVPRRSLPLIPLVAPLAATGVALLVAAVRNLLARPRSTRPPDARTPAGPPDAPSRLSPSAAGDP